MDLAKFTKINGSDREIRRAFNAWFTEGQKNANSLPHPDSEFAKPYKRGFTAGWIEVMNRIEKICQEK